MIAAIIQARMGSSRLPGKMLMSICGKPALQRVIERVKTSKVEDIIVATTINEADDAIIELCDKLNCKYYRGSENDVLLRVLEAAREFEVDTIVEITGDMTLVDYKHINTLIDIFNNNDCDIALNAEIFTFPRGFETRVFSREALERCNKEVDNPVDRQHVSTWMFWNPKGKKNYKIINWEAPCEEFRPDLEFTLDTPEDLEFLNWIYSFENAGYNLPNGLDCQTVINLVNHFPHMYAKVDKVKRKNVIEEENEWYEAHKNELRSEKKNEKIQLPNRRRGRPRSTSGRAGKRK
jgi:spore coat polysaccharide biosynthesis protein SpsF